jgi:hypothetical protein
MALEVTRLAGDKPFLGGFRNTKTAKVFHHACSQTPPVFKQHSMERFHRETQTAETKTRSVQLRREFGTQMARAGVYIDTRDDRVVVAKPYISSEEMKAVKAEKTLVIQCYWRGFLARKLCGNIRAAHAERRERLAATVRAKRVSAEETHRREVERRTNPRKPSDFAILYNELNDWRSREKARLAAKWEGVPLTDPGRQAELKVLMENEVRLLQMIEKMKLRANSQNQKAKTKKMLELMAAPKLWALPDGEVCAVHTPLTSRAAELRQLYLALNATASGELLSADALPAALRAAPRAVWGEDDEGEPASTPATSAATQTADVASTAEEQRLMVLLHVKWTVKEFSSALTADLVSLIDREADLLHRGRGQKSLVGLRRRVANRFLHFLQTPDYNPEASRFQKVPSPSKLMK